MSNFYTILDLPRDATREQIRSAWLRECKLHHPDAGGSAEHMAEINLAYSTLSDPIKRKAYDEGRDPSAPDPIEAIISGTLVGVFNVVMTQAGDDIDYLDLLGRMRKTIQEARAGMLNDLRTANRLLLKQKAIARKLRFSGSGINPLHGHLQQSIDTTIKSLQTGAEQRKGMKLALEYLDNYTFEYKVREQHPSYMMMRSYQPMFLDLGDKP